MNAIGKSLALVALATVAFAIWPSPAVRSEPGDSSGSWSGIEIDAVYPPPRSSSEARIVAGLNMRVEAEFHDVQLSDAMRYLCDQVDIPWTIDLKSFDDAGVSRGVKVGIASHGGRLRLSSAMNLMFKPVDLGWTIRDEVLFITSSDEAQQTLDTRVYEVTDLIVPPGETLINDEYGSNVDFDSMIELITSTVHPTTWDAVGGPGSIAPSMNRRGLLVISQTYEVQAEVQRLLVQVRQGQGHKQLPVRAQSTPLADAPQPPPDRP